MDIIEILGLIVFIIGLSWTLMSFDVTRIMRKEIDYYSGYPGNPYDLIRVYKTLKGSKTLQVSQRVLLVLYVIFASILFMSTVLVIFSIGLIILHQ